jgi:hypothetical protein
LPRIMQWLKQTFAVRYNLPHGRSGHIWGDRYWSRILEAGPLDWAEEWTGAVMRVEGEELQPAGGGVSPLSEEAAAGVSPLSGEATTGVSPRTENPPGHAWSFAKRNSENNRVSACSATRLARPALPT